VQTVQTHKFKKVIVQIVQTQKSKKGDRVDYRHRNSKSVIM